MRDELAIIDIEKHLLSTLMLKDGATLATVGMELQAEDFARPEHRVIYWAMQKIYERGIPPDPLLVEQELSKQGLGERVSRMYLYSVMELEYTTARAEAYAQAVKEASISRRLIKAGHEISDEAADERLSISEVLSRAEQKILAVSGKLQLGRTAASDEVLKETFERILSNYNKPDELSGVPTGLNDLNKVTNGLQKSDLILLAARPSMGKTALALNMANAAAKAQKVVMLFSLEMSKLQIGMRLLSTASGVNSMKLQRGDINDEEMNALVDGLHELTGLKLYIDDTAGITLLELRSKARRIKHEHGLDLIVIDYLQLMQGGHSENRQQEISEISRNLKALARELEVPILALSQLSRSVEMRAEKKPQLSDLRESGSLEQDADIVMFLYRDEYYNRDDADNENLAELIIAKNRNGATTSIHLQFQKETMRFGDLTRREV